MAAGFSFGNPSTTTGGAGFSFGSTQGSTQHQPSFGFGGKPSVSANTNTNINTDTDQDHNPSSSPSPPSSVRALAWDPTGTSSLSLCPPPSSSKSSSNKNKNNDKEASASDLDVFLSHDGTGCSPEETECLLRCLDAREESIANNQQQQQQQQQSRRLGECKGVAITKLSMDYRAAMCDCLLSLQTKAHQQQQESTGDDGGVVVEEENNIELSSLTYAISHLSEIFLLPSLASSSSSTKKSVGGGDFHDNTLGRLDGPAGSLTADCVRYLRLHHSKESMMNNLPEVIELLDSEQPEYYQFPINNTDSTTFSIPGPFDYPYWNLLLHYIIHGQLAQAWELLQQHSTCRGAEADSASNIELSPEGQGFATLHALLLSAPLPGGRGDGYCDDAGLDDYLEEEYLEEEEEESRSTTPGVDLREDGGDPNDPGDINEFLIDGVAPNAYLLWEALPRRADKLRSLRYRRDLRRCGRASDIDESSLESPTVPEVYQPRVAVNAMQVWQESVRNNIFPGGGGSTSAGGGDEGALSALFRRFPPLAQILSILVGVVPPTIANDASVLWSEVLLMELLYTRQDIMPSDIAVRANAAMSKVGGGGTLQHIILSIMNGSAGQVVETMFSLCGGSSGAALPATMTSLLCNLLVDAGCIVPQKDSSKVNIQTELLLLAAESILSSFSVQEQSDVGVRTAVRLLMPFAPPKRAPRSADIDSTAEASIIYEPRIAAMIAEALSHRQPATDAEARDLLELCEGVVCLGSVLIADACESLAFSRASYHSSKGNLTREVYWLLRGMEVQSSWLPSDRQQKLGFTCRRHFDSLCEKCANDLVSILSVGAITNFSKSNFSEEEEKKMVDILQAAKDVLDGVLEDEVLATVMQGHMEANLLRYAVDIAIADVKGDTTQVATAIIHCIEERVLSEDYGGVVSTLANPSMYAAFLNIAFAILVKEEQLLEGKPMEFTKCSFSVHGIHMLMARLTQVLSWESKAASAERKEYFTAMRLAFCKGLSRAFISGKSTTDSVKTSANRKGGEISLDEEVEDLLSACI